VNEEHDWRLRGWWAANTEAQIKSKFQFLQWHCHCFCCRHSRFLL